VYSNLGIIAEVLLGRGTAFAPDDARNLADTLLSIHDNFLEAEKVSKKNIEDIQLYTWNKKAQKIIDFLEQK
jgi:glycosyltransferase involved in cell wall biosynthesis